MVKRLKQKKETIENTSKQRHFYIVLFFFVLFFVKLFCKCSRGVSEKEHEELEQAQSKQLPVGWGKTWRRKTRWNWPRALTESETVAVAAWSGSVSARVSPESLPQPGQVQRKWMDGHGGSHLLMLNKWHFISYYSRTGRDVDVSEDFIAAAAVGLTLLLLLL